MDPITFAHARLNEEAARIEASIEGEIERLAADGVEVNRNELLTDDPPHYESPFLRPLREVDVHRKLAHLHRPVGDGDVCASLCHARAPGVIAQYPCPSARVLATLWPDHADYDQTWKPEEA